MSRPAEDRCVLPADLEMAIGLRLSPSLGSAAGGRVRQVRE
jgi:hypothetical protein